MHATPGGTTGIPQPAGGRWVGGLPLAAVGLAGVLQLLVGFFTWAAIGLVAVPLWAIIGLAGLWLAATALLVGAGRGRPLLTPLIPVVNALLLWAAVAAGGLWLGWTA